MTLICQLLKLNEKQKTVAIDQVMKNKLMWTNLLHVFVCLFIFYIALFELFPSDATALELFPDKEWGLCSVVHHCQISISDHVYSLIAEQTSVSTPTKCEWSMLCVLCMVA